MNETKHLIPWQVESGPHGLVGIIDAEADDVAEMVGTDRVANDRAKLIVASVNALTAAATLLKVEPLALAKALEQGGIAEIIAACKVAHVYLRGQGGAYTGSPTEATKSQLGAALSLIPAPTQEPAP